MNAPTFPPGAAVSASAALLSVDPARNSAQDVAWPATAGPTPLQLTTLSAGECSLALVQLVRDAHSASCEAGGPMELLLREAIADAVQLADRLATLAQFAREGR